MGRAADYPRSRCWGYERRRGVSRMDLLAVAIYVLPVLGPLVLPFFADGAERRFGRRRFYFALLCCGAIYSGLLLWNESRNREEAALAQRRVAQDAERRDRAAEQRAKEQQARIEELGKQLADAFAATNASVVELRPRPPLPPTISLFDRDGGSWVGFREGQNPPLDGSVPLVTTVGTLQRLNPCVAGSEALLNVTLVLTLAKQLVIVPEDSPRVWQIQPLIDGRTQYSVHIGEIDPGHCINGYHAAYFKATEQGTHEIEYVVIGRGEKFGGLREPRKRFVVTAK